MKVNKTTDYDKFSWVQGNRTLDQKHIQRLADSLKQANLLESNPVIVNEKFEIIDGQHRVEAAKLAQVPVHYLVRDGARLGEVILLNSLNKTWSLMDYVDSFIERGRGDYQLIKTFCETYGVPVSQALTLLNKTDSRSHYLALKQGTYEVNNLYEANALMEMLMDYKPYCEGKTYLSRDFIRVLKRLLKEGVIDNKIMLKKLESSHRKIQATTNLQDMYRQLEDIYNFHSRNKVRFF